VTESAAPLRLVSTSRASDGSFTAISEIGALLCDSPHRLIGGVAVVLHQHRLGLAHPVRATADADFGVPPYALRDDSLVAAVSRLGYQQVAGNRWSRPIDETREATVDLLVPSYRTRVRSSVQHGGTNTTEVGGLALALKRPAVTITGTVTLTDGNELPLDCRYPMCRACSASRFTPAMHAPRTATPSTCGHAWSCSSPHRSSTSSDRATSTTSGNCSPTSSVTMARPFAS